MAATSLPDEVEGSAQVSVVLHELLYHQLRQPRRTAEDQSGSKQGSEIDGDLSTSELKPPEDRPTAVWPYPSITSTRFLLQGPRTERYSCDRSFLCAKPPGCHSL